MEGRRAERSERRAARLRNRPAILVIDDEAQTATAVKHLLRKKYNVLTATGAEEGLSILDDGDHGIAAVLCDMRMPGMDGAAFFREAVDRHPKVVRILITAYANLEALATSINEGQIFAYVSKPFSAEALERVVETAVTYREMVDANERMTRELSAANNELQHKNDQLQAYTHVVAHDLKEPMRTIAAYARFLREECGDALSGEGNRFLDGITRCAGHMSRLVEDLLEFTRLDHEQLKRRPVTLGYVFEAAAELVSGSADAAGARLELPPETPTVVGDVDRLVVLFQNLFSNAIKFNKSDVPLVEVSVGEEDGAVVVDVRDNGIGIAEHQQALIFQIFERLHPRSDFPGTGAGLAIVRKIVEMHGATITVTSTPGTGATFRITFPSDAV